MNEFPIDRPVRNRPFDSLFVTSASTADRSPPVGGSFGELLLKLNDRPAEQAPRRRASEDAAATGTSGNRPRERSERETTIQTDKPPYSPGDELAAASEKKNDTESMDDRSSDDLDNGPNDSEDVPSAGEEILAGQGEADETNVEGPVEKTEPDSDVASTDSIVAVSGVAASGAAGRPLSADAMKDANSSDVATKAIGTTDVAETDRPATETETLKRGSRERLQQSSTGQSSVDESSDGNLAQGKVAAAAAEPGRGGPNVEAVAGPPGDVVVVATDNSQVENQNIAEQGQGTDSQAEGEATTRRALPKTAGGSSEAAPQDTGKRGAFPGIAAAEGTEQVVSDGKLSSDRRPPRRKEGGRRTDAAAKQTSLAAARSVEPALKAAVAQSILETLSTAQGDTTDTAATERSGGESAKPAAGDGNAPKPAIVARLQRAIARGTSASSVEGKTETQVDRVRFVERVARAFQTAVRRGDEQIRLRLSPASLGSLNLEVSMKGGELTARLEAETNSARTLLLDNLGTLRDRLSQEGIKVDKFDVGLMDRQQQDGPTGDAQRQASERRSGSNPQRTKTKSDIDVAIPATASVNMQNDDDRLNVVI